MTDLVKKYNVANVQDYSSYSKAVADITSQGWNTFYSKFCYNEAMFMECLAHGNINTSFVEKVNFMNLFQIDFEAAVGYVTDYYKANYLCGPGKSDAAQSFDCVTKLNIVSSNCYMSEYNCWALGKYQDCVSNGIYNQSCGTSGKRYSCNIQNLMTSVRYSDCTPFLSDCS